MSETIMQPATPFSHAPQFNMARLWPVDRCPACESGNCQDRRRDITDRYGFVWNLATCESCGLEFQRQPLTADARRWFYSSGEYRRLCEQMTGKPGEHPQWTNPEFLREQQFSYALRWLTKWGRRPFATGRWLDYGGSTGAVSAVWKRSTDTVIVADYGDGATVTPEEAIEQGTAQPYDTVLCCQTLDHLPHPLETLTTFHAITRSKGSLFVDVAKGQHTDKKIDHDTYWNTATAFVGCVERAGWTVQWYDGSTNPRHHTIGARKA